MSLRYMYAFKIEQGYCLLVRNGVRAAVTES